MPTSDERLDKTVLPILDCEKNLPTQIHEVDEKIKWLESEVENLNKQIAETTIDRETLIKRAKEVNRLDDGKYKMIEVPVYPKKRVAVDILKRDYEDKYKLILANISERIKDKAAQEALKAESFISQSDVKSVVRDKTALMRIIPEVSEPDHFEINVVERK